MTLPVTLRALRADDADAVAAIWEAAWRDAHAVLGPEGLDRARSDTWYFTQARGFADTGMLALHRGAAVGFATWQADEVTRLFVAPGAPRVGIGSTLLAAAEFALLGDGVEVARLHCREGNAAGRRFLERKGWTVAGTEEVPVRGLDGDWRVACWRMTKAL